jgi:hypothetical protein
MSLADDIYINADIYIHAVSAQTHGKFVGIAGISIAHVLGFNLWKVHVISYGKIF